MRKKKRNQKVNFYRIMKLFFSPSSLFFVQKKEESKKVHPVPGYHHTDFYFDQKFFLPRPSPCDQVSIFFTNGHGASRG